MEPMLPIAPYAARWYPPGAPAPEASVPARDRHPVRLRGGATLELPLRAVPDGSLAIALLMTNQTTFAVETELATLLAQLARRFAPDVVAGVPTMGLDYARTTARALGLAEYVALGISRKFWYDDALSEPATSITSTAGKRLYLDPALQARVVDRRVLLVDDVITTGGTAAAAIRLLARAGATVVGLVAALTEGHAWRATLDAIAPRWSERVSAAGHIPLFRPVPGGWAPVPETLARPE